MRIKLKEEHGIKQIKSLFKIVLEMLNYKDIKNLGYFKRGTWKSIFQNRKNKKYLFKIILNNKFVGWVALTYEHKEKSWNVAYMVFKKYRGNKIATLATKKLLIFAKKKKLKHIHTKTNNKNISSIMVLEKNGFIQNRKIDDKIYWERKL